MDDLRLMADEVRRAVSGDPWFGSSATAVLAGVDAATAMTVPDGEPHSIWQHVLHMRTWARHMTYRVAGGPPAEPADGDWPTVEGGDEDAWAAAIETLVAAHEELASTVETASIEWLDETGPATPVDGDGAPITLRRAVLGVPQHDAYHLGQIVVLKRLLA